jgi:hypothetical protein
MGGGKIKLSLKGWERNISKRKSINKNIRFCFVVAARENAVSFSLLCLTAMLSLPFM